MKDKLKWLLSEPIFNKIYYTVTPIISVVLLGFVVEDGLQHRWFEVSKDIIVSGLSLGIMLLAKKLDKFHENNKEDI